MRRPLGEPSLAGLISVSRLFQEALEELRVSPFYFQKGVKKGSLMKLQALEKI